MEQLPNTHEIAKDPFFKWLADMSVWGTRASVPARSEQRRIEFVLTTACTGRYGLQLEEDGELALGVPEADRDGFFAIPWEKARIAPDFKKASFLVLECADVVLPDSVASEEGGATPYMVRLVMPIEGIKAAALAEATPKSTKLRLRASRTKGIRAVMAEGSPRAELPLQFDAPKKAEPKPATPAAKPGKAKAAGGQSKTVRRP